MKTNRVLEFASEVVNLVEELDKTKKELEFYKASSLETDDIYTEYHVSLIEYGKKSIFDKIWEEMRYYSDLRLRIVDYKIVPTYNEWKIVLLKYAYQYTQKIELPKVLKMNEFETILEEYASQKYKHLSEKTLEEQDELS